MLSSSCSYSWYSDPDRPSSRVLGHTFPPTPAAPAAFVPCWPGLEEEGVPALDVVAFPAAAAAAAAGGGGLFAAGEDEEEGEVVAAPAAASRHDLSGLILPVLVAVASDFLYHCFRGWVVGLEGRVVPSSRWGGDFARVTS